VGVLALGRGTFDVSYANQILIEVLAILDSLELELLGCGELLLDADQVNSELALLEKQQLDIVLLLQVTFTDASLTLEIGRRLRGLLVMWSFPEPRTGGRLRLNSLCGINLAAHALSRAHIQFAYIHGAPSDERAIERLGDLAGGVAVRRSLLATRIGVIGTHPDGFDSCMFSHKECGELFGVEVVTHDLITFLDSLGEIDDGAALQLYDERRTVLVNLDEMDKDVTLRSLKAYLGMRRLVDEHGYHGLAVRCWPEFFTHYGAAACGALALLGENDIAGGCEADVHGVITSLILRRLAGEPAFNTDLVDLDPDSNTCVFWHCGQAPVQLADPNKEIRATIHSNRKLPLLHEFALKPGRITMARISKGHDTTRIVIGGAEMLRAPLPFSGTSGVARLDSPVDEVLANLMEAGLEHHTAIVYGEHRPALRVLAARLGLDVVELTT